MRFGNDRINQKKWEKIVSWILNSNNKLAIWIKDKADKFYKRGDYQAAINAYTEALQKDPTMILYPFLEKIQKISLTLLLVMETVLHVIYI